MSIFAPDIGLGRVLLPSPPEVLFLGFDDDLATFPDSDRRAIPPECQDYILLNAQILRAPLPIHETQFAFSISESLPEPSSPSRAIPGQHPGPFKDFLGVPDTDPDVLVLWSLKEKYQRTLILPEHLKQSRLNSRAQTVELGDCRLETQDDEPVQQLEETEGTHSSLGKQQGVVEGWEPSDGESLPLVNISFDQSLLSKERRPRADPSDERHGSRSANSSTPTYQQSGRVSGPESTEGPSGLTAMRLQSSRRPLVADDVPNVSTTPNSTTPPSEDSVPPQRQPTEHPITKPQEAPRHSNSPLYAIPSIAPAKTPALNITEVNAVRKFHTLVPPHLAKSITRNTMKAREDESLRIRSLQQESMRAAAITHTITKQDDRLKDGDETLNIGRPSSEQNQHPASMAASRRGLPEAGPVVRSDQSPPPISPPLASTASNASTPHVRPVGRQVAISLPLTNGQNWPPSGIMKDHAALVSAASRVSTLFKNFDGALRPITTSQVGNDPNIIASGSERKENAPSSASLSKEEGRKSSLFKFPSLLKPLSPSNMVNVVPMQRLEASHALKRAWEDANGHLDASAQKKPRL